MIYDLIKTAWKPLILIALVSLTITWAFGIENQMITQQTINGIKIYTFNIHTYMSNISNSWETNALNFDDILPSRTWQQVTGSVISDVFWNALFNNLAFIFDWLYMPINFILYILRWLCWLLKILLAIIGWNTLQDANGNYYSVLAQILAWITQNLMIPYI